MYSIKKIDGKEYKTEKRSKQYRFEFDRFKDVLINEKVIKHKMRRIQGKKHKLGTY